MTGVCLWSIAKDWDARGLFSPHGKEWRSSNLRGVLLKPRNAGIQTYSQWVEKPDGKRVRLTDETGAGNWEAIVSEGIFRALVRYLSDPERNTGGSKRKALLSGVVRCSKCQAVATQGRRKENAAGERYRIYTCSGGRCITCPADALDSFVVRKVMPSTRPRSGTRHRPRITQTRSEGPNCWPRRLPHPRGAPPWRRCSLWGHRRVDLADGHRQV
ncbi:recombinase family protein [Streptomyces sp. NPDC047706]|uniref:recombinase family protein n=1 Tax=Streptomyces sp. NPDC047706 TaxID=3365486 RepID=UPI00371491C7